MKITISGASGFVGRRLLRLLLQHGHQATVLSRHAGTNLPAGVVVATWDPMKGPPAEAALASADAVIHLAGEPIAQRWTDDAKRRIRESRATGTRHLVEGLKRLERPPQTLISASAIGYYGSRGDELLTESSSAGSGFLAEVCMAWEQEALAAAALGIKVHRLRLGMVLDRSGGALPRMLTPFRLGLGGRLGDGKQWMSWIHIEDLTEMIRLAVERPTEGVRNAVAPYPVSNAEFTRALAAALHRPAVFPVPGFGLKILFGEMAEVLLSSQRVVPRAAEAAGLVFRYPQLPGALAALLK